MFPIQCFSLTELRQTKLDPGNPTSRAQDLFNYYLQYYTDIAFKVSKSH